ncbi:MAG TPA: hypothetical protein PLX89_20700 [Verrucomicrobiota bacterium]|nr:hypothetical protein [Verrucomicrobiales bacterium]HRI15423.1 hypothetical protein [Verrucomicrobiota bacterium]
MPRRFRIAFSFAGEKRDFVEKVADILAAKFGKRAILYDKFHQAEFARYDSGIYIPKLYSEESDLIVPIFCPSYDQKRWTGWEWVHIYSLLTKGDGHRVMPSRFEYAVVDGLSDAAAFVELDHTSPGKFAVLILERLAINEGLPNDHFSKGDERTYPIEPREGHLQEASALPDRTWVWHSSLNPRDAGRVSVLACVETVGAVVLYWWMALQFNKHWLLLSSVFVAPLLLLRSPGSVKDGVNWFLRDWWALKTSKCGQRRRKPSGWAR